VLSRRRVSLPAGLAALVGLGLGAAALSRLGLHPLVSSLIGVAPGWLVVACALMMLSLLVRAVAWLVVLRAAVPGARIPASVVARATMIGVMVSAVLPGRLARAGSGDDRCAPRWRRGNRRRHDSLADTAQPRRPRDARHGGDRVEPHAERTDGGAARARRARGARRLVLVAPGALRRAPRSGPLWLRRATGRLASEVERVRGGLRVFRRPREGVLATLAQLAVWAVQVLSAYAVLQALGLARAVGLAGAAAILVAVNVTAVVPVTPSNVGLFQAACVAVLAAFGVFGPSR
jgi:uncharacterized membrane protein YbhN (UPF0104 family)